jgi:hypothetical protein
VTTKILCAERGGQWIARAVRVETGDPFGVEYAGVSEDDARMRLTRWLDWQREHAAALDALQQSERAYHRAIAGGAFANAADGASVIELQKQSLAGVEAARVRLDEVRSSKPE